MSLQASSSWSHSSSKPSERLQVSAAVAYSHFRPMQWSFLSVSLSSSLSRSLHLLWPAFHLPISEHVCLYPCFLFTYHQRIVRIQHNPMLPKWRPLFWLTAEKEARIPDVHRHRLCCRIIIPVFLNIFGATRRRHRVRIPWFCQSHHSSMPFPVSQTLINNHSFNIHKRKVSPHSCSFVTFILSLRLIMFSTIFSSAVSIWAPHTSYFFPVWHHSDYQS